MAQATPAYSQEDLTPNQVVEQILTYNHDEISHDPILEVEDLKRVDGQDGAPRFQLVMDVLAKNNLPVWWLENRLMPMRSFRNFVFVIQRNNTESKLKINGYNELKKNGYLAGSVPIEQLWPVLIQDKTTFYEILTKDRKTTKAANDLLTEFQDFIEWHNKKHPEDKVEIALDWQLVQKKYHYADYISLFQGRVDWSLVFKRQKLAQTEIRITTQDEFKELLANHNADPTKEPIHSKSDYEAVFAKYLYPHVNTVERNLKQLDWDYVFSRKIAAAGEIVVNSDAEFEALMLKHNINHPEYPIRYMSEYLLRFEKYNYPTPDSIAAILEKFDWKKVYVRKQPPKSKMVINSVEELEALIDKHNSDPTKGKIKSVADYRREARIWHYPSYEALNKKFEINWDKIFKRSKVVKSEIEIETEEQLKELIEKHNRDYPNDPIHSGNDYARLAGDYRYPGATTLRRKFGEVNWDYIFGRSGSKSTPAAEKEATPPAQDVAPTNGNTGESPTIGLARALAEEIQPGAGQPRPQTSPSNQTAEEARLALATALAEEVEREGPINPKQSAANAIIEYLDEGNIGDLMGMKEFPDDARFYLELEVKIRAEVAAALFQTFSNFNNLSDLDIINLINNFSRGKGEFQDYYSDLLRTLYIQQGLDNGGKVVPYEIVVDTIRDTLSTFVLQSKIPADRYEIKKEKLRKNTKLIKADHTHELKGSKLRLLEALKLTTRR